MWGRAKPLMMLFVVLSATSASPWRASASTDLRIICQPCEVAEDCGDHADLCLVYPGEGNFCGMHCGTDEHCAGLSCQPTEIAMLNQCADIVDYCRGGPPFTCSADGHCDPGQRCVEGRCVDDGGALGEACEGDEDCVQGACLDTPVGRICTERCDPSAGDPDVCVEGFACVEIEPCGDGVCIPGAAGEAIAGEPCVEDLDCASRLCLSPAGAAEPQCSRRCDPALDQSCAEGAHCQEQAVGCGACFADCLPGECQVGSVCLDGRCQPLVADGEPCVDDQECRSGLCVDLTCGGDDVDAGPDGDAGGDLPGTGQLTSGCSCVAAPRAEPAPALGRVLDLLR